MSLDFVILGPSGRPETQVGLACYTHEQFIMIARKTNKTMRLRFSEYYEDAEVSPYELPALRVELNTILTEKIDMNTKFFVENLLKLVDLAIKKEKYILEIAD
jgi:hypothetical protein